MKMHQIFSVHAKFENLIITSYFDWIHVRVNLCHNNLIFVTKSFRKARFSKCHFSVQLEACEKSGKDVVSKSCTGLGFARDWLRWQNLWSDWLEYVTSVARVSVSPLIPLAGRKRPLQSQNRLPPSRRGPVRNSPQEFKTGFHAKNESDVFLFTLRRRNLKKTQQSQENSFREEIVSLSWCRGFRKPRFSKWFPFTRKRKTCVPSSFCLKCPAIGLTIEIK